MSRERSKATHRLVAILIVSIVLLGLAVSGIYFLFFRTIPVTEDPTTWISVEAVKLGSAKTVPSPRITQLEYRFDKEVPILPKPEYVDGCMPTGWYCQPIRLYPSTWTISPIRTEYSPTGAFVSSYYGVDIDLDQADRWLPDIGAIVKFIGWSGDYARYNIILFVSARATDVQDPSYEYWWYFTNTYFVFSVVPWYRTREVIADGNRIIAPTNPCLEKGDCAFELPLVAKSPSDPAASYLEIVQRTFMLTSIAKTVAITYQVDILVDRSRVVGTAGTTIRAPTVTITRGTTMTVTNPTTIIITNWQTVTRTITFTSVQQIWQTVINGQTTTITSWIPAYITQTRTLKELSTTTVTLRPGETVTKTVVVERTVTQTQPPSLEEIGNWLMRMPWWLWTILALLIIFIAIGIASSTAPRTTRGRRGGRR